MVLSPILSPFLETTWCIKLHHHIFCRCWVMKYAWTRKRQRYQPGPGSLENSPKFWTSWFRTLRSHSSWRSVVLKTMDRCVQCVNDRVLRKGHLSAGKALNFAGLSKPPDLHILMGYQWKDNSHISHLAPGIFCHEWGQNHLLKKRSRLHTKLLFLSCESCPWQKHSSRQGYSIEN